MKASKKISFIMLCIIVLITTFSCKNTPKQKNVQKQEDYSEIEVKSMLMNFYESYTAELFFKEFESQEKIDSISSIYLTKKLIDYLDKKYQSTELDYDPFTHAQMFGNETLRSIKIRKDESNNNIYYISFFWSYEKKLVTIKLGIIKENKVYKIDHVFLDYFTEEEIDK